MDNIIKQGYLKRAKPTPANRTSMATQILQMFEPQRWYVLGIRNRRPYLEFYDKEEHVFSEQPINTFPLEGCKKLTYTLGRTNKNWTFCLFLHDRVIELTAESRPHMLDWCRVLERTLHNYGCLKKTDNEHIYSEYPVKPVPKKSEEESIDASSNVNGAASSQRHSVNVNQSSRQPASPNVEEGEIIFGTQFSLLEAIGASNVITNSDLDNTSDSPVAGVVYRRKASLLPDGDSEPETSEDDFVNKDFWLNNKLPTVPKRNFPPPIPERNLSLVMPQYTNSDNDLTPTQTMEEPPNFNLKKDAKTRQANSAPVLPSQTSVPTIPPRRNTSKPENMLDLTAFSDEVKSSEDNSVNIEGACGHVDISSVDDLDDGYQSIVECKLSGPKFVTCQKNENLCDSAISKEVSYVNSDSDDQQVHVDKTHEHERINYNMAAPLQDSGEYNMEHVLHSLEDQEIVPLALNGITQQNVNSNEKTTDENFYSPFPSTSDDNTNTLSENNTSPKNSVLRNSGETVFSCLTDSREVENKSNHSRQLSENKNSDTNPPEPPALRTLPRDHHRSSDEIVIPPRIPLSPSKKSAPDPPSLDSLPHRISPDQKLKLSDDHPKPPSLETLPKRGLNVTGEYSHPVKRSLSDPKSQPVPPARKTKSKSGKLSTSMKQNVSVISVTTRPLPSLPTEDEEVTSPSEITILNGRSSPSFDNFKFNTTKSGSLSSNSSGDTDAAVPLNDYEDATMRHKPPSIPPRLKTSLDRRSHSVYVPSQKENVELSISSNGEDKAAKGITRQTSLQDRQRIHRSSGAFAVVPLKQSQAELLKEEQELHGVALSIHYKSGQKIALVDCFQGVWVAGWEFKLCPRLADRLHIGDELIKINDTRILNSAHAHKLMKHVKEETVELVVRRIPYGKVIAMRRNHEREQIGIHREGGTAVITYIDPGGLAAQGGLEKKAKAIQDGMPSNWMLTEINNRPLNLSFKGSEIDHLLNAVGRDISIVVQPEEFIKTLKKGLKKYKNYKDHLAPS